ncbi:MAG: hypothetical protein HQL50_14525, partial [Magnetococcales bacterium]|nr:hypothetical protein [Magnetococcales bacterium]
DPSVVTESLRSTGADVTYDPTPASALHDALASLGQDGRLVITGSIHLLGIIRPMLEDAVDLDRDHH